MTRFNGEVAIITGASVGQGAATARLFASEGANVVIADILEEDGRKLADELGDSAIFHKLDVSDESGWIECVRAAKERFGRLDILINNAGILRGGSILEIKAEDFRQVLDVNLLGTWLGIKHCAPSMVARGKGAIVNIASTAGLWGMHGLAPYSSSKWALRGLTKAAAMELGHLGVRVNIIFPGGINTRMANIGNKKSLEELNRNYQGQPIQRIGDPAEVARVSLFLVSDDASYLCGSEIAVDGGMTLGVYKDYFAGAPKPESNIAL